MQEIESAIKQIRFICGLTDAQKDFCVSRETTVELQKLLRIVYKYTEDLRTRSEALLRAAEDVVKFTEPEWRDDIDRGDADLALAKAIAAYKGEA